MPHMPYQKPVTQPDSRPCLQDAPKGANQTGWTLPGVPLLIFGARVNSSNYKVHREKTGREGKGKAEEELCSQMT